MKRANKNAKVSTNKTKVNGCFVHPTAIVESNVIIGENTKIWHFAHVREGAFIGKDCTVGKDCFIDTGVRIGNNVKIQNGVSIYKGVAIDGDVFVGPNVTFTNDPYPRAFSKDWKVLPTHIKKGASIGANATLVCGIEIGDYAMVAAGAVVIRSIPDHCMAAGNPASIKGFVCICGLKVEEIGRNDNAVLFKCIDCSRIISIPLAVVISVNNRECSE